MRVLRNFVVFEGIDGAGTSTQLEILKEKLAGKNAHFSAEPTNLETGRFLRRVLAGEVPATPETVAFLFAADRQEHIFGAGGIAEKDRAGTVCFSDRYFFSSLAYQGSAIGMEMPARVNRDFPLPRLLFYFDINPEESLKRIAGRGVTEIYEKEAYLVETRAAYEQVLALYAGGAGTTGAALGVAGATQEAGIALGAAGATDIAGNSLGAGAAAGTTSTTGAALGAGGVSEDMRLVRVDATRPVDEIAALIEAELSKTYPALFLCR